MVEEDAPAVVDEHRPLDVALDADLLLLLADPGEVEERLHVAAAEDDHAAEDERPRCRRSRAARRQDAARDDRARDAAAARSPIAPASRAGDEQPERAGDAGRPREPRGRAATPGSAIAASAIDERDAGERGEVVVAEERRLPVARPASRRRSASRGTGTTPSARAATLEATSVTRRSSSKSSAPPDEQHRRRREQRVLDVLPGGDEVVVPRVRVGAERG